MTTYAVLIETAGGHCSTSGTGLTRADALVRMREVAEYDMREMGLGPDEIEGWRDGSLLAPGAIYSVIAEDSSCS
jgi:hypothetical protein